MDIEGLIEKAAVLKAQIAALQEQLDAVRKGLLDRMLEQGIPEYRYGGFVARVVRRCTFSPRDVRPFVSMALEEDQKAISVSSSFVEKVLKDRPELVSQVDILHTDFVTLRQIEES